MQSVHDIQTKTDTVQACAEFKRGLFLLLSPLFASEQSTPFFCHNLLMSLCRFKYRSALTRAGFGNIIISLA